jgi:hypothetical protein
MPQCLCEPPCEAAHNAITPFGDRAGSKELPHMRPSLLWDVKRVSQVALQWLLWCCKLAGHGFSLLVRGACSFCTSIAIDVRFNSASSYHACIPAGAGVS